MNNKNKDANENKEAGKGKKRMSFARFANLLYEASSSLVPGTGEFYNTEYANDVNDDKSEDQKK